MPKLKEITNSVNGRRRAFIAAACLIGGIIFIAVGVNLMQPSILTISDELEVDYTDCIKFRDNVTCKEYRKTNADCVCQYEFEVHKSLIGDVILYYQLDMDHTDNYEKSRDDLQLSGQLLPKPAAACEPYRYNDLIPIAPCGEIADTMFTDLYSIRGPHDEYNKYMNVTNYGMIKDKGNYHNPKRENMSEPLENVFQNFSKPKRWSKNIWELDKENDFNNGFENERFIGWMETSLKRKPAWRLSPAYEGFTNGTYILRVDYDYPPSLYSGPRKVVFVASRTVPYNSSYGGGVAMVVIGVIALLLSLVVVGVSVREEGWKFYQKT